MAKGKAEAETETEQTALSAQDIRALLQPLAHAFRGLAQIEAIVDQAIVLQDRGRAIAKQHDALQRSCAALREQEAALTASIEQKTADALAADGLIEEARARHATARSGLDASLVELAADVRAKKDALTVGLRQAQAASADALAALDAEHARLTREVEAARAKLAEVRDAIGAIATA